MIIWINFSIKINIEGPKWSNNMSFFPGDIFFEHVCSKNFGDSIHVHVANKIHIDNPVIFFLICRVHQLKNLFPNKLIIPINKDNNFSRLTKVIDGILNIVCSKHFLLIFYHGSTISQSYLTQILLSSLISLIC